MSAALQKIKSPRMDLTWVRITGEGVENLSGKMQYTASGLLDEENEEHAAFMAKIDEFWEANKPKGFKGAAKSTGIYPLTKKDEDGNKVVIPGKFYVSFKTGTSFPDGSQKEVKIFNSKAVKVDLGAQSIGNGSRGYISGAMDIYELKTPKGVLTDAGVTLYLDAIQLTKFVPYEPDSGFDEVEDDEDEGGWTGGDADTGITPEAEDKPKPRL